MAGQVRRLLSVGLRRLLMRLLMCLLLLSLLSLLRRAGDGEAGLLVEAVERLLLAGSAARRAAMAADGLERLRELRLL